MKVIRERTVTFQYVVPDSQTEDQEIRRIIKNAESAAIDLTKLRRAEPGQTAAD